MKKIVMLCCTIFSIVSAMAESLGDGIGAPGLAWTSQGDEGPWYYSATGGHNGGPCVVSGGGGGGTATAWLRATVNGPCRISFRYLVQTYTGTYTVKSDDVVLHTWTGITGTETSWQSAQYDIPSGAHVLEFSYTHKGIGYANKFNGVKISGFTIDQSENKVIYVAPSGNDGNDGLSKSRPKLTVQSAVDYAQGGDIVCLSAGVYRENVVLAKQISLLADVAFSATIDGGLSGRCMDIRREAAGCVIDGIVFTRGVPINGGNTYGGGIACAAYAQIRNCIFKDNGSSSQYFGGGLEIYAEVNTTPVQVYNCLFSGNVVRCSGGAVLCEGLAEFNRCTIYGNTCTGWNQIGGLAVASGGRATLKNCIVWGNDNAELGSYSGGNSGTYSVSYSCIEGGSSGTGNISENPVLANVNDYMVISSSSPCKNSGDPLESNEDGTRVDMGFSVANVLSLGDEVPYTFDCNYEGGGQVSRNYFSGMQIGALPTPERSGYAFVGWFTSPVGGDAIGADSVVNSSATTLYAHWSEVAEPQRAALDMTFEGNLCGDGSCNWTIDSNEYHKGGSSLRSPAISHSQNTWQKLTVVGSGTFSFWWKVSSESNYDWLRYYVDGEEISRISGAKDWTKVEMELEGEGEHVIMWQYSKDYSVNNGEDCGWIDCVSWTGKAVTHHTVTFDMNGDGEPAVRECKSGDPIGELPKASKTGYVLTGWFTAREGGTRIASDYLVDSNVTVYAQWVPEGEISIISTKVRDNDATVLDVVYRVNSTNNTANARMLVFEDGEMSFSKVIRPETFVDGTHENLGYAVPANTNLTVSWRFVADWDVKLARIRVMILVEENFYPIPLDIVVIPRNGANSQVEFSTNEIDESKFKDALYWLYADKTAGLELSGGVLSAEGSVLAQGSEVVHPNAERYVFKSMGYALLEGESLRYVNETARLSLSPDGSRQYAVKQN